MRGLPNIERSAFKRGEYVGYAHGTWRIVRQPWGWQASWQNHALVYHAPTLAKLSDILAAFAAKDIPRYAARDAL